jgi:hypothetical protein
MVVPSSVEHDPDVDRVTPVAVTRRQRVHHPFLPANISRRHHVKPFLPANISRRHHVK